MSKRIILKVTLIKVVILLVAVFIAELFGIYGAKQAVPVSHKQIIIGLHAPGQIPDSTSTDSNDNTTYYFKPTSND